MKNTLFLILVLFVCSTLSAQPKAPSQQDIESQTEKVYTWDIEKLERGSLMFLDVPFKRDEAATKVEFLSVTVAKDRFQKRPDFISIIVPNSIDQSKGLFVHFANSVKDEKGNLRMELAPGNPSKVDYQICDTKDCTVRIIGGYVTDPLTKANVDLFEKFMQYDHVLCLFVYPDGKHKSVSFPLATFKKQYEGL